MIRHEFSKGMDSPSSACNASLIQAVQYRKAIHCMRWT